MNINMTRLVVVQAVREILRGQKVDRITAVEARAGIRMFAFTGLHDLSIEELKAFAGLLCKLEKIAEEDAGLSAADYAALHHFAFEHGRTWKQALRDEWMRACSSLPEMFGAIEYRGVLQRLRNRPYFGTEGLIKFRLPLGFKFKGKK